MRSERTHWALWDWERRRQGFKVLTGRTLSLGSHCWAALFTSYSLRLASQSFNIYICLFSQQQDVGGIWPIRVCHQSSGTTWDRLVWQEKSNPLDNTSWWFDVTVLLGNPYKNILQTRTDKSSPWLEAARLKCELISTGNYSRMFWCMINSNPRLIKPATSPKKSSDGSCYA